MKSRSHRVPNSDPPDDWVDGSWTVDCICGVNFDDGEEMVNCDECGVWVHTRCSRFVKGEKSFACDKCKSKDSNNNDNYIIHNSNGNNSSRNDAEETEVAQLLVELPLKTIKMSNNSSHSLNHPPTHRPRLWYERPMDDRVHIQGVPGGDPALFQGLSSVFTSELWKCTGYVPKKFNFRYKEFPCWDQQRQDDGNIDEDNKRMADNGAGVLCSLSKETLHTSPRVAVVNARDHGSSERKSVKEKKSEDGESIDKAPQDSKNKGHDLGPPKDRDVKKKSKIIDRKSDAKKKRAHALKTAVTFPSEVKLSDDKDAKATEADFQVEPGVGENDKVQEATFDASLPSGSGGDKKKHSATGDHILEALSSEMSGRNSTSKGDRTGRANHVAVIHDDHSPKTSDALPLLAHNDAGSSILNGEKLKPLVVDSPSAFVEVKCDQTLKRPEVDMSPSCSHPNHKSVIDAPDFKLLNYSSDSGVKMDDKKDLALCQAPYADPGSGNPNVNDTAFSASTPSAKLQEFDKGSKAVSDHQVKKSVEVSDKQEVNRPECLLETHKMHAEVEQGSKSGETTSELGEAGAPRAHAIQHKLVSVGKSSSGSSTIVISKSSVSDKPRISSSQNINPFSKRELTDSIVNSKKDSSDDLGWDDGKHEMLQKTTKDLPNSSADSASKMLHPGRNSHTTARHTSIEAKDHARNLSPKTSSAEKCEFPSSISDCTIPMQSPEASLVQNKSPASAIPPKGEKVPHTNSQSSSKAGYSSLGQTAASSNTPTGLSDEELALLLHQELNSSPRVPRVPRVRHAGSLPQLSSASATSLLIKRTSGSGGKDQHLSSRRKNKDVHEPEVRRTSKLPSSPDSAKAVDALTEVEANNDSLHHSRKSSANVAVANSGPSSSNDVIEHNVSSLRDSPGNNSDEDTGTKGPVHRTLPGLIAEIMSKGRRMTYAELCNAVRPHWRNLRKHNGERYAYSSHSQAVLDCLRNRTEWARLVDRGPKTSGSRKRRKIDDEPPNAEVEGDVFCEDLTLKDVEGSVQSSREEFPKGKRKARKRRRLALQGRGVKDVRKRRKRNVSDDDSGGSSDSDSASASNSGEDTGYSEGESQGGGAAGTEASTSSDETATMSE